ncbi:MMPL family transporter [Thalassotalea litorea]|uniref:MMPL family transporter n=1 Tax=Thalassotalea litorea TaxID=2020715 RepID=UPI003736315D
MQYIRYAFWAQLSLTILLLVVGIISGKLKFNADILALLPHNQYPEIVAEAETYFVETQSSRVRVSFSGDDKWLAHQALREKAANKNWLDTEVSLTAMKDIINFYRDYAGNLVSDYYLTQLSTPNTFNDWLLSQYASADPFVSATINDDPSLSLANYLSSQLATQSPLTNDNDALVSLDQRGEVNYVWLFLNITDVKKDFKAAQEMYQQLNSWINEIKQRYPNVDIEASGIPLHAAENSSIAEFEVTYFGGLSLIALIILVYFAFRSLLPVIAINLSLANAILVGLAGLIWCFEQIHLLSLVFGITLVGICIDYCFHILADGKFSTEREPSKKVLQALMLGFLTTLLAYLLFLMMPIELLAQVSVFVGFGLLGALLSSIYVVPKLVPRKSSALSSVWMTKVSNQTWGMKPYVWASVACLGFAIVFLNGLKFDDRVALLSASSEKLVSSESMHRKALGLTDKSFIYLQAKDIEDVLVLEESVSAMVNTISERGKSFGISNWLPSQQRQVANLKTLQDSIDSGVFALVNQMLTMPISFDGQGVLTLAELQNSAISQYAKTYLYQSEQGVVTRMEIDHIDKLHIEQLAEQFSGQLIVVDKQQSLTQAITELRFNLMLWAVFAMLLIVVIFWFKFDTNTALRCIAILVGAVVSALAGSQLVQQQLNIFNMLSVILLMALAVDYLALYRIKGLNRDTTTAIFLSAASSLIVFGMLIFSHTPAVFSFGLTVTFGVIFIYFTSPFIVKDIYENRTG